MKISVEDEGKVIFQNGEGNDITPKTTKEINALIKKLKNDVTFLEEVKSGMETSEKEEIFTVKIGNGTDSVNIGKAVLGSILLEGHKVEIEKHN